MGFRLRAPSPTTVIACLALFLALGGSGYMAFAQGGASVAKKKKVKVGPQGPQGPAGPAGRDGTNGATVIHIRQATGIGDGVAVAVCNPGETLTGGGATDTSGGTLKTSIPNSGADPTVPDGSWTAVAVNSSDNVTVRILCASP